MTITIVAACSFILGACVGALAVSIVRMGKG